MSSTTSQRAAAEGNHAKRRMIDYKDAIESQLHLLDGREVLIVGDIGLDEYVLGDVRRISPEAPVPVVEVDREEARLGLAANVAQNIASLGGVPRLVAVVGNDASAESLRRLLREANVGVEQLIVDDTRPTTRKLRVMVGNHHIVRVDYEHRRFVSAAVEALVLEQVRAAISNVCAVIIQDYAKGVISEGIVREIVAIARAAGKKILADPNMKTPICTYHGVDLMTPNFDEAVALSGVAMDDLRRDPRLLDRIGERLMNEVDAKQMVVTLGKDGMRIFESGSIVDLPTNAKQVFDVTGAGDTVIAALALSWGSGFSLEQACALANFAAGVVVAKVGCVPCSRAELLNAVRE